MDHRSEARTSEQPLSTGFDVKRGREQVLDVEHVCHEGSAIDHLMQVTFGSWTTRNMYHCRHAKQKTCNIVSTCAQPVSGAHGTAVFSDISLFVVIMMMNLSMASPYGLAGVFHVACNPAQHEAAGKPPGVQGRVSCPNALHRCLKL